MVYWTGTSTISLFQEKDTENCTVLQLMSVPDLKFCPRRKTELYEGSVKSEMLKE